MAAAPNVRVSAAIDSVAAGRDLSIDETSAVLAEIMSDAVSAVQIGAYAEGLDRLKTLGLISEIIAWKLRLFVPTGVNGPDILAALLERHPVIRIADRGAA